MFTDPLGKADSLETLWGLEVGIKWVCPVKLDIVETLRELSFDTFVPHPVLSDIVETL